MATMQNAILAYEANEFAAARRACAELVASGRVEAAFLLGLMDNYGEGGPVDPAAAARYFRIAADAGHPGALFNLAALHAQGRGVPLDFAEARRLYLLAAEAGSADALFQIGILHANGEGVPADLAEAGRWWDKAAAAGQPQAMQHLGRLYAHGHGGRPKDPGVAAHWYFRAWQAGSNDVETDIIRVRQDLEDVAEAGDAGAQNALGLILCFGHDDAEAAASWFEQAAAADHPEAVRMLGYLFESGKGMPKDDGKAAELYRRAAELGDAFAQLNLGLMIDHARGGLTRDLDQAIDLLRRAADQGLHQANLRLAELLAERNRDRDDVREAIQRLWLAARQGPEDGEYRIASGDGSWAVILTRRDGIVGLHGLSPEEVQQMVAPSPK